MLKKFGQAALFGLAFSTSFSILILVYKGLSNYGFKIEDKINLTSETPENGIGSYKPSKNDTYDKLLGLSDAAVQKEPETQAPAELLKSNDSDSESSEVSHVVTDDDTKDRFSSYPAGNNSGKSKPFNEVSVAQTHETDFYKEEEVFTGVFLKLKKHRQK